MPMSPKITASSDAMSGARSFRPYSLTYLSEWIMREHAKINVFTEIDFPNLKPTWVIVAKLSGMRSTKICTPRTGISTSDHAYLWPAPLFFLKNERDIQAKRYPRCID